MDADSEPTLLIRGARGHNIDRLDDGLIMTCFMQNSGHLGCQTRSTAEDKDKQALSIYKAMLGSVNLKKALWVRLVQLNMFKPSSDFVDCSKALLLL